MTVILRYLYCCRANGIFNKYSNASANTASVMPIYYTIVRADKRVGKTIIKDIAALPCKTVMFRLLASSGANIGAYC